MVLDELLIISSNFILALKAQNGSIGCSSTLCLLCMVSYHPPTSYIFCTLVCAIS